MIDPLRSLMFGQMRLDVVGGEFSAGYGIADLVGGELCPSSCREREELGIRSALDNRLALDALMIIQRRKRTSLDYLLNRMPVSRSTISGKILPLLSNYGLIDRCQDGRIRARFELPNPARKVVAIEAKQSRWREAILQARRYTFFANQTYVALWNGASESVDKRLLYRHRLGLISVESNDAEVVIEAPLLSPRRASMHRFCAEWLYKQLLVDDVP